MSLSSPLEQAPRRAANKAQQQALSPSSSLPKTTSQRFEDTCESRAFNEVLSRAESQLRSANNFRSGIEKTIQRLENDIDASGFWNWASGQTSNLRDELKAETKLLASQTANCSAVEKDVTTLRNIFETAKRLDEKAREQSSLGRTKEAAELSAKSSELLKQGTELGKELFSKGRAIDVDATKANLAARSELAKSYEESLAWFDKKENQLRTARNVTLAVGAAGATVMTGGGAAIAFASVGGIATVGNAVEGAGHVGYGNKSASEALKDSALQTGKDFINIGTSVAGAGAGKLVGQGLLKAALPGGKLLSQGGEITKAGRILSGAMGGGSSGFVSTGISNGVQYMEIKNEFNSVYGHLGASEREALWSQVKEANGLSTSGLLTKQAFGTLAGMVGGVVGGGGASLREGMQGIGSKAGALLGETALDAATGMGVEYMQAKALGEEFNSARASQAILNAVQGSIVGESLNGRSIKDSLSLRMPLRPAEMILPAAGAAGGMKLGSSFDHREISAGGATGKISVLPPAETRSGVAYVDREAFSELVNRAYASQGVGAQAVPEAGAKVSAIFHDGSNAYLNSLGIPANTRILPASDPSWTRSERLEWGAQIRHETAHAEQGAGEFGARKAAEEYLLRNDPARAQRSPEGTIDEIRELGKRGIYSSEEVARSESEFAGNTRQRREKGILASAELSELPIGVKQVPTDVELNELVDKLMTGEASTEDKLRLLARKGDVSKLIPRHDSRVLADLERLSLCEQVVRRSGLREGPVALETVESVLDLWQKFGRTGGQEELDRSVLEQFGAFLKDGDVNARVQDLQDLAFLSSKVRLSEAQAHQKTSILERLLSCRSKSRDDAANAAHHKDETTVELRAAGETSLRQRASEQKEQIVEAVSNEKKVPQSEQKTEEPAPKKADSANVAPEESEIDSLINRLGKNPHFSIDKLNKIFDIGMEELGLDEALTYLKNIDSLHRQGIKGTDKLVNNALNTWDDAKRDRLPGAKLLRGCFLEAREAVKLTSAGYRVVEVSATEIKLGDRTVRLGREIDVVAYREVDGEERLCLFEIKSTPEAFVNRFLKDLQRGVLPQMEAQLRIALRHGADMELRIAEGWFEPATDMNPSGLKPVDLIFDKLMEPLIDHLLDRPEFAGVDRDNVSPNVDMGSRIDSSMMNRFELRRRHENLEGLIERVIARYQALRGRPVTA